MYLLTNTSKKREPWNKGKITGQKPPLKLKEVWSIRIHLQLAGRLRDLAMFNLAIDSKLRACDLVKLRVRDISHGDRIAKRAIIMQQKTHSPVQFEITAQTRDAVIKWIDSVGLQQDNFLFPSRFKHSPHISTRQYARIVESWVARMWRLESVQCCVPLYRRGHRTPLTSVARVPANKYSARTP